MENKDTLIRHTCSFCGVTFWSKRPDSRFHNRLCRQAAYRWRKRLPRYEQRSIAEIDHIAEYLAYPASRPMAANALLSIQRTVTSLMRQAGVKSVK